MLPAPTFFKFSFEQELTLSFGHDPGSARGKRIKMELYGTIPGCKKMRG